MIPKFECHRVMPEDITAEAARKSQFELAGEGLDKQRIAAAIKAAEFHNASHNIWREENDYNRPYKS